MAELINPTSDIKTFEVIIYVTGWLDGDIKDWPANIQDGILEALERKADEVMLPLAIVHSRCDIDYGETSDKDRFFLHIIASEIVARDERFTSEQAIKRAFDELIHSGQLNNKYH